MGYKKHKKLIKKNLLFSFLSCILYLTGFMWGYRYIWDNLFNNSGFWLDSVRNILEYSVMFLSFTLFNAFLWKNRYLRVFSVILSFLLSLNFAISISCYYIYESSFNVGMALSVLETNPGEIKSMSKMFVIPIIGSLLFFCLLLLNVSYLSKIKIQPKYRPYFVFLCLLWLILPFAFFAKHQYISNKGGGFMVKNIAYHLTDFMGVFSLNRDLEALNSYQPNYSLEKIESGVENIVVVIGESAVPNHMTIYGYGRDTTPFENAQKNNIYLYKNAVSPAAITNLSIPLTLSTISPSEYKTHYEKLGDNIINLANNTEYKTFWLSTQGGAKGISVIANFAKEKKWIDGYDEKIIPVLEQALKQKGKKLIFIHINGSHPNPCDKYPRTENYFTENTAIDCYDNSIRYTDKILGKVFNLLESKASVMFYLSDHGVKIRDDKFLHIDSKESTKVPFYIWSSAKAPEKYRKTGANNDLTQTTILYPLIMEYMGYKAPENYKNKDLKYLTTGLNTINYEDLND